MGSISVSLPSDGTTADVSDYNTPITTIVTEFNGNIDNANIKSSAAIDGSKIANATITNSKLATSTGELGGSWQTWTPTLTGMTLGNGTVSGRYIQYGKTVFFKATFTLGSTSSVGVNGSFSLPVAANSGYVVLDDQIGVCNAKDVSAVIWLQGYLHIGTSLTAFLNFANIAGNTAVLSGTTSIYPITWATGDIITMSGTYEAA